MHKLDECVQPVSRHTIRPSDPWIGVLTSVLIILRDRTAAFSFHQSGACFNFCNGQFQNTNTFFFGSDTCVTGCRHSDRTIGTAATTVSSPATSWFMPSSLFGSPNTASAQVTNPSSTNVLWNFHSNMNQNTAAAQVSRPAATTTASNGVSWFFPSSNTQQVASAQIVPNPAAAQVFVPAPAPQIFVPPPAQQVFVRPAQTVATVTTLNQFASQQAGRGSIAAAQVSGPRGTVNAVVSGAGKAIPFARSTNVASTQIFRNSCSGGKMGSCGKMGSFRSRVQSYEALAGVDESASVAPSVAVAATSAVLLWNIL